MCVRACVRACVSKGDRTCCKAGGIPCDIAGYRFLSRRFGFSDKPCRYWTQRRAWDRMDSYVASSTGRSGASLRVPFSPSAFPRILPSESYTNRFPHSSKPFSFSACLKAVPNRLLHRERTTGFRWTTRAGEMFHQRVFLSLLS